MKKTKTLFPPLVFNVFKPARMSSYDVVRHFKRNLPTGFGKIGHFGTLDPFASGVLMIGIAGAARLNDLIHELMPKTYVAVGKLGIETPTGDYTSEISQTDNSVYLRDTIGNFSKDFIQDRLREKFLGDYMQAPHKYSAAKFMGKNLHEWARQGVEVKKEAVQRHIFDIQVLKYSFPYLSVKVTVSSGTYVRTLFSDMCNDLGTIGSLIALVRTSVGHVSSQGGLMLKDWPKVRSEDGILKGRPVQEVLRLPTINLDEKGTTAFRNGAFLKLSELEFESGDRDSEYFWMQANDSRLLGLAHKFTEGDLIKPKINFAIDE